MGRHRHGKLNMGKTVRVEYRIGSAQSLRALSEVSANVQPRPRGTSLLPNLVPKPSRNGTTIPKTTRRRREDAYCVWRGAAGRKPR